MDAGNAGDFETLVAPLRTELRAYCYRMLGSVHDAEDALQEALLGAWRGLHDFEGRSSLRSWLYRIATNACLRVVAQRPLRVLPDEHQHPATGTDVEKVVEGPLWLEPYPVPLEATYAERESLELAFVAALQHVPATQRAALILREVLGFTAEEVSGLLETTVASVNSALQRARQTVTQRVPPISQQAALSSLGDEGERALVAAYVNAWAVGDVNALVALLARDVRFSMPPIPTWFLGRDAVARFFGERVFATAWRLVPMRASGQLAFACYQGPDFRLSALNVIAVEGETIRNITGFCSPSVHAEFLLPDR
jgi:RNA polymerase sigma-70 factor (TIGR02960 family)